MKVTNHQVSKVDPSKVWKGTPSLINQEARDAFVEWLSEKEDPDDPHSPYVNQIVDRKDICASFDLMFKQRTNPDAKPIDGSIGTRISTEAKQWGGLDRDDPCVDKVRFRDGILKGGLYTWSTMPFYRFEEGKMIVSREVAIDLIREMPCH